MFTVVYLYVNVIVFTENCVEVCSGHAQLCVQISVFTSVLWYVHAVFAEVL